MAEDQPKYQPGRKPELRIQGVSKKTHDEINNIAMNQGCATMSEFMRPHLARIIESYPEKMRKPPLDY